MIRITEIKAKVIAVKMMKILILGLIVAIIDMALIIMPSRVRIAVHTDCCAWIPSVRLFHTWPNNSFGVYEKSSFIMLK